jgi:hypothetical protein
MKKLIRLLSGVCVILAILLFLVGSLKTVKSEKSKSDTIVINKDSGIEMVKDNPNKEMAGYAFNGAVIFLVAGIGLWFLGSSMKK